jgi:hypothetical protein
MKKDDIIGQKLFETCKLSEFYLNLITNSTYEDTESPTLLSTAYRQKLYEIVERYDRLLETSRQREKLCLTFDNPTISSNNSKLNKPPIGSTTRTSTPNKYFNNSAANTPAPTPTSFSANQKYHPLAITPSNQSFLKSSISNYTLSNNHQRLVKTNSSNTLNNASLSRSSSTKNLSKIGGASNNSSNHSNSLNQSKLAQRLNYIYYDYTDEEDDDEVDDDDFDEDEDEMNLYNNDNKNNYYNTNKQTLALNLDSTKLLNKLNKNSNITDTSSSSLLCSIKSMNTRLDRLKINLNDSNISDYSNITNVTNLDQTSSTASETNQIEKSFSNMSKDSGVFASEASGYNSDFSSTTTLANNNGDKLMNGDLTNTEDESINNNSTSPSSSTSSTTPNYEDDVGDVEEEEDDEDEDDDFTNSYDVDSNQKNNSLINNSNRLLWSNMTQKSGARIVKGFTANQLRSVINPTTGTTISGSSLKEQFLTKKLLSQQDTTNKYSTMILNKPKSNNEITQTKKLMNLELDLNDLDNSNMMSLMMMNNSASINNDNNNSNKDVMNGSYSTPSPSSSTISSSSSSNNSHNDTLNRNDESILSISPETTPNNFANSKQSQFFFNNYNSLMNVSMLDNIQATNTSLEFDNMNSSILTFN